MCFIVWKFKEHSAKFCLQPLPYVYAEVSGKKFRGSITNRHLCLPRITTILLSFLLFVPLRKQGR